MDSDTVVFSGAGDVVAPREIEDTVHKPLFTNILDGNIDKLRPLVAEMLTEIDNIPNHKKMNDYVQKLRRKHHTPCSNPELLYAYRMIVKETGIKYNDRIDELLQKASFRSQSGVMVVTIFTSPYPLGQEFSCEYNCKYCPKEPDQPRSYLKEEPGVARANRMGFDCVKQIEDRVKGYLVTGHSKITKLEVLVLGGTWHSYPEAYRDEFVRDIYFGANTILSTVRRERKTLEEEMIENETADCRIIGLTIETRPDRINPTELRKLRRYGVTRVQLGVQHLDDRVLTRIDRRCTTAHFIRAQKYLLDACFKFDIHLMPDLPKPLKPDVDPKKTSITAEDIDESIDMRVLDREMLDRVIADEMIKPDQIKVYPCQTVPWTEIEREFREGIYKPYGESGDDLFNILVNFMSNLPPWVRANRVIRDIPVKTYVMGGTREANMRQFLDDHMRKEKIPCMEIRHREVKKQDIPTDTAILVHRVYKSHGQDEHFLSFETPDMKTLFGFLRLRLSEDAGTYTLAGEKSEMFSELVGCALIRELHVYGDVVHHADKSGAKDHQHVGFGTRLMYEAFRIAKTNGFKKIAVISGNGVKEYYRKPRFGFADEGLYLTRSLDDYVCQPAEVKYYCEYDKGKAGEYVRIEPPKPVEEERVTFWKWLMG